MSRQSDSQEDGRIEAIDGQLQAAYLDTQYHYVQFLTEHLADCAAAFGGDLDSVLLLAILGQRRIEIARADPQAPPPDPGRMAMSTLRIADVSGIPRETARRKLEALRAKGWIEKDPRFGWHIAVRSNSPTARVALADLEARSFRRLARLHVRIADVLARGAGDDRP